MRVLALAAMTGLALAACSPGAPKGVDKAVLDAAVRERVGDPGACVLIGESGSGKVVYRFGSNVTCGRVLPSCEGATRTVEDLLKVAAGNRMPVNASCASVPDGARTVAWAAGGIEGRDELVYAAAMEGDSTPPGLVIADKLAAAFAAAGLVGK